jgi:hypothetical protein
VAKKNQSKKEEALDSPDLAELGDVRLGSRGGEVHLRPKGQVAVHDIT